jgi:small-conductance mechanosensitive channel
VHLAAEQAHVLTQHVTAWDWAIAAAVFAAGIVAGRVVRSLLARAVRRGDSEFGAAEAIGRTAGLLVTLAALTYALVALGVRLGPFVGALGIGGIAIAFAAQTILSNFLASVILQIRRPCRRGEQVTVNGVSGVVEEINFRTVVVRTYDGERVFVPSAKVLNDPIYNHTRLGRRRTALPVSVPYDVDLDKVRALLGEAVRRAEGVLPDPPADVWVESFADSGVQVVARFWHPPDIASMWRVRSAVAVEMKRALDDAGIDIPFPQLVLRSSEP